MYLSAPSILQNFRKILRVDPELMTMCHFQVQNGLFVRNKIFFDTNHYHYFHLPKKILTENPEL